MKLKIINITICLKNHKKKQKQIYIETIDHDKVTETDVAE